MLRLLFYLFAVVVLPGAAPKFITVSSEVDISSCPVTYYGQKYERLYVNFTSENFVICFNGFYDPQNKGSCVLAPKEEQADFGTYGVYGTIEQHIHQNLPTITNSMECLVYINTVTTGYNVVNFGSQTVLVVFSSTQNVVEQVEFLVDGDKVKSLTVNQYDDTFADLTGCRHSGVVYKPGDTVSSDPDTCVTLTCSDVGVLQTSSCGPLERCQGNGVFPSFLLQTFHQSVNQLLPLFQHLSCLCWFLLLFPVTLPDRVFV